MIYKMIYQCNDDVRKSVIDKMMFVNNDVRKDSTNLQQVFVHERKKKFTSY